MNVHFSSKTDLWATPQDTFDPLHKEFGFTLDVCATLENAKCPRFFTKENDGLAQDWSGEVCWMNPPYGREIGHWMNKAWQTGLAGGTVVCLVPARTDTAWWHDFAMEGEVRFLRGRLKFGGHPNPAPFPSAIVVFGPQQRNLKQRSPEAEDVIVDDQMVELACAAYLGETGTAFNWENAGEEWRTYPRIMMRRALKAAITRRDKGVEVDIDKVAAYLAEHGGDFDALIKLVREAAVVKQ